MNNEDEDYHRKHKPTVSFESVHERKKSVTTALMMAMMMDIEIQITQAKRHSNP